MKGNTFINNLIYEMGYTQEQISERSGVSQQVISKLKIGSSKSPSFITAQKLSQAFEVDINDIFQTK
jgi:transcriptional regulator with XRE-family HTH domain|tara:strand:+ start:117 stop:317 length:201 start_codon:yes stop_codon:yes gene_type:complete